MTYTTDIIENAPYRTEPYTSPQVKVICIKSQGVLCQTGNDTMREYDYGNGNFGEE